MYDNPLTHKFHLDDVERQAKPFMTGKDDREATPVLRYALVSLAVVATAGVVVTSLFA